MMPPVNASITFIMREKRLPLSLFSLFSLLLLVLVAGTLQQPLSAQAAVGGPAHITATRQEGRSTSSGNMLYHGGPVMTGTAKIYAVFWEPTSSHVSATYHRLIKRYFHDIGGSPLYHNNSQYTDAQGNFPSNAVLAGTWIDRAAYPSNPLQDADVRNEVSRAQQVKGWTSSLDTVFFVFTAKDENICTSFGCSFSQFCAYHSYFGTNTIYAAIPYTGTDLAMCGVASPNHDPDADSTINMISHEQNEAATDPLINAWYDASGSEIGDPCNYSFGPPNSLGGDVIWNGHPYEVQGEWDNAKSECVLAGP